MFFGMVLILLDSNRSGIKPGALQTPLGGFSLLAVLEYDGGDDQAGL